jgi:hypothetical protein
MLLDASVVMRNPVSNGMVAGHRHELGPLDSDLRIASTFLS